jgi:hypothetical protein
VGPVEDSTRRAEDQKSSRRQCASRRPRTRRCLLKGCERRVHPRRARQRYCSDECRRAARRWSRWKAQQSYRATAAGKDKRNGQSRRYRERVRKRKQPAPEEAVPGAARVITKDFFSTIVAIGRAATRDSFISADRPISASARARAGALWSESGSAKGVGATPPTAVEGFSERLPQIGPTY